MVDIIRISNEGDAFDYLNKILNNSNKKSTGDIQFTGWPLFEMRIKGENYNCSIPTSIMPPMLDMQKVIHNLYCQMVHNHQDVGKLVEEERNRLEIVFKIKDGSTNFSGDLVALFNHILRRAIGNMTPREETAMIIIVACLITGGGSWKEYLNYQAKIRGTEFALQMSEQETERMRILRNMLEIHPELQLMSKSIDDIRNLIVQNLKPYDELFIGGKRLVNGKDANLLVQSIKASKESEHKKSKGSDIGFELE